MPQHLVIGKLEPLAKAELTNVEHLTPFGFFLPLQRRLGILPAPEDMENDFNTPLNVGETDEI